MARVKVAFIGGKVGRRRKQVCEGERKALPRTACHSSFLSVHTKAQGLKDPNRKLLPLDQSLRKCLSRTYQRCPVRSYYSHVCALCLRNPRQLADNWHECGTTAELNRAGESEPALRPGPDLELVGAPPSSMQSKRVCIVDGTLLRSFPTIHTMNSQPACRTRNERKAFQACHVASPGGSAGLSAT
jgi:hypothetical protein